METTQQAPGVGQVVLSTHRCEIICHDSEWISDRRDWCSNGRCWCAINRLRLGLCVCRIYDDIIIIDDLDWRCWRYRRHGNCRTAARGEGKACESHDDWYCDSLKFHGLAFPPVQKASFHSLSLKSYAVCIVVLRAE